MKLTPKKLPHIALIGGILALAVRTWLFLTGIDGKNLVMDTHPGNALTYILIALTLGLIFLVVRPVPEKMCYPFRKSLPAMVGAACAGVGILYTTIRELPGKSGVLGTLSWVLGLLAVLALLIGGAMRYQGRRPSYFLNALVTAYLMVHILAQYRGWNNESQLQMYLPQLFASVFLMISAYYRTALDSGSTQVRSFLFFNYGAMFLCCLAIGSLSPIYYLGMVVWTATACCTLEVPEEKNDTNEAA